MEDGTQTAAALSSSDAAVALPRPVQPIRDGRRFQLRRFTVEQNHRAHGHAEALKELRRGKKRSCWIWWIVPVPAKKKMSARSRKFAIRSDAEAVAYLAFSHGGIGLRTNLIEIFSTCLAQIETKPVPARAKGGSSSQRARAPRFRAKTSRGYRSASALLGSIDAAKLMCSLALWQRVAASVDDAELGELVVSLRAAICYDAPSFAIDFDFYESSDGGGASAAAGGAAQLLATSAPAAATKSGKARKAKLLPHEAELLARGALEEVTHPRASARWLSAPSTELNDATCMCTLYRPMGDPEAAYLRAHGTLPSTQPYQAVVEGAAGRAYAEKFLRGAKRVDTSPTTVVEFVLPLATKDVLFELQHKCEDGALSMGLGDKAGGGLSRFNANIVSWRIVLVKRPLKRRACM